MAATETASYKFLHRLRGKRVLIFGGSSGIGFGVAEGALEYGASVIISSSTQAKLDAAASKLKSTYPGIESSRVTAIKSDLSDAAALETNLIAVFEQATHGGADKIDHIVFTAGDGLITTRDNSLAAFTVDSVGSSQTLRYTAPILIGKLVPKYVHQSVQSSYTLTSGVLGRRPRKGLASVMGIPGALDSLVRGLAVDLAPVRSNLVIPGLIATPLSEGLIAHAGKEAMLSTTLTNTIGQPEDIAEAYIYFMKDRFVTGQAVVSDGGFLLK